MDDTAALFWACTCLIVGLILGALILGLSINHFLPAKDKQFYSIDYSIGGAPHITCGPKILCNPETATCSCDTNSIMGYDWVAVEFTGITEQKIADLKKAVCGKND